MTNVDEVANSFVKLVELRSKPLLYEFEFSFFHTVENGLLQVRSAFVFLVRIRKPVLAPGSVLLWHGVSRYCKELDCGELNPDFSDVVFVTCPNKGSAPVDCGDETCMKF